MAVLARTGARRRSRCRAGVAQPTGHRWRARRRPHHTRPGRPELAWPPPKPPPLPPPDLVDRVTLAEAFRSDGPTSSTSTS